MSESVTSTQHPHAESLAGELVAEDTAAPRGGTIEGRDFPAPAPEVRDTHEPSPAAETDHGGTRCLNCDTPLGGRYCARCGQDSHHHVHSLRHTLTELVEDMLHADARIWRTLQLLALRPGALTLEYLRGRRASYIPPFRVYFFLSLLFLAATTLKDASEPKPPPIAQLAQPVPLTKEAATELDEGVEEVPAERRARVRAQLARAITRVPAEAQDEVAGRLAKACANTPMGEALLNMQSGPQELLQACKLAGRRKKVLTATSEFAPETMFFFLPVIAAFGKLLYRGSRRYYIGHLLFFVHFHAFVFLAMASGNLVSGLANWSKVSALTTLSDWVSVLLALYVPIYLYKAMRRVYEQGRTRTRIKLLLLGCCYLLSFGISVALVGMFTADPTDS